MGVIWFILRDGFRGAFQLGYFPLSCLRQASTCRSATQYVGEPHIADNISSFAVSPDGKQVVLGFDFGSLSIVDQQGTASPLTEDGAFDAAWAPDSRSVLYYTSDQAGERTIWVVSLASKERAQISTGLEAVWASDSQGLLFRPIGSGSQILLQPLTQSEQPTRVDFGSAIFSPSVSVDGTKLAVVQASKPSAIMVHTFKSDEYTSHALDLDSATHLQWSPSSRLIAFSGNTDRLSPPQIYVLDTETSSTTLLAGSAEAEELPSWVSDTGLAFLQGGDIWYAQLGAMPQDLTSTDAGLQISAFQVACGPDPAAPER